MLIMVQGHLACGICRLTLLAVSAGTWTMIRSAPNSCAPVNLPSGAVIFSLNLYSAAPCPDTFAYRAPAINSILQNDHLVFAAGFQGLC